VRNIFNLNLPRSFIDLSHAEPPHDRLGDGDLKGKNGADEHQQEEVSKVGPQLVA